MKRVRFEQDLRSPRLTRQKAGAGRLDDRDGTKRRLVYVETLGELRPRLLGNSDVHAVAV